MDVAKPGVAFGVISIQVRTLPRGATVSAVLQIFMQSPAESAIPQVNQTKFAQNIEHIFSKHPIYFDINHDGHRAVMRRWDMNKLM